MATAVVSELAYNAQHQVLICRRCKTVVGPGHSSLQRHLRRRPHHALGPVLKACQAYADSLALRTLDELRQGRPRQPGAPLEFLDAYEGYSCLLCEEEGSSNRFYTIHLPRLQRNHLPSHHRTAREHELTPLWRSCQLQTYFSAKGRIDYFEVDARSQSSLPMASGAPPSPTMAEQALFTSLERDASTIQQDLNREAAIVQDISASRTERVPWLEKTGFPAYLAGLQDRQIKGSYQLPPEDPNSIVRR